MIKDLIVSVKTITRSSEIELLMEINLGDKFKEKKTVISFIIAIVAISLFLINVNFSEVLGVYSRINILYYSIAFSIFYLNFPLRGFRWKLLLKNVGIELKTFEAAKTIFLSFFVNTLVPAKLGDLYRGYLLKKNRSESASKVTGTVFTERAMDFMLIVVLLTFSSLFIATSKFSGMFHYLKYGYLFAVGILALFLIIKFELGSKYLPHKINNLFEKFREGMVDSLNIKTAPKVLSLTVLIWGLGILRIYFLALSLEIEISIYIVTFLALFMALLSAIPLTPAGLGAVEILSSTFLVFVGVTQAEAVSLILLVRTVTWMSLLLIGSAVYIFSKRTI